MNFPCGLSAPVKFGSRSFIFEGIGNNYVEHPFQLAANLNPPLATPCSSKCTHSQQQQQNLIIIIIAILATATTHPYKNMDSVYSNDTASRHRQSSRRRREQPRVLIQSGHCCSRIHYYVSKLHQHIPSSLFQTQQMIPLQQKKKGTVKGVTSKWPLLLL